MKAVAVQGKGVLETLYMALKSTFRHLNQRYEFERKFGLTEKEFLRSIFKNVDTKGVNLGEELA